jgi:diguanylate cyclase (GGDEF)-like protein
MPANVQHPFRERRASVPPSAHPADSSRILMTLLSLVRAADETSDAPLGNQYDDLVKPGVLRSLLSALHYRDEATVYHSRRVALAAVGIAGELGWDEEELRVLEISAMLHDLGKIGVPDSILRKPAALSPDEAELVAQNFNVGLTILQACRVNNRVIELISQSARCPVAMHSDHRGNGDMHLGARILAVSDMYDSLVHDQSYRSHLSHSEAINALIESDRQLDRNVIAALRRWLAGGGQTMLADQKHAADVIRAGAPIDTSTIGQASSLCHAFAYLHILESLYDAYYITDSDLRLVVCSHGLTRVFPESHFVPGEPWSRRLIGGIDERGQTLPDHAYPLHKVLETNHPYCSVLKLPHGGERHEVEFHAIPLQDARGGLHGVAEIVRDLSHSKRNPTLYTELRQAANQDPLTGVANRGQLEARLADLFADYAQADDSEPFSVIFLDIDHFKKINDTYEHATGDEVLVNLVRLLEDELYSGETLGRYGGEEFLILCPGTDMEHALKRAERVRRSIQNARLVAKHDLTVTASLGVAVVDAEDTQQSVLHRADQALYDAKRGGRNRVCFRDAGASGAGPSHSVRHAPRFVHETSFVSCMADDILVFKLKGFVQDHGARLLDVKPNLVALRLGETALTRRWGKTANRQPVEMIVTISEYEVQRKRAATRRVKLDVTVTPVGKAPDEAAFEARAMRAVELLRSYLLAD